MNNTINKIFIFSAGVAIGVAASWKFFETKYKKIAQEEIDSVKEVFSVKKNESEQTNTKPMPRMSIKEAKEKEQELDEYNDLMNDLGYTNKEKGEDNVCKEPYIISPEEFGELADYDTESLTYFDSNNILTDDFENPIEDIGAMVVEDFAEHFGEYEDDSVFVRNEYRKTDYEILRDERNFKDVHNSKTYPVDEE